MPLPYTYQITQYNPLDRDARGAYIGRVDAVSDEGPLEAAYLAAVDAFASEVGVSHLTVRDPHVWGPEDPTFVAGKSLTQIFGDDLCGLYDGALVDLAAAKEIVRGILREEGGYLWCRLEAEGLMTVHVGYDVYMYIATSRQCPSAAAAATAAGLFPEELCCSPYALDEAELDAWRSASTPINDAFWGQVDALVREHGGVLVEEEAAWTRWHRVTADAPRPALRPRCRVWVWPDLTTDTTSVRARIDSNDLDGTVVWETGDHQLRWATLSEDELPSIRSALDDAVRVGWQTDTVDEMSPLMEAVNPDGDGVIRARWEPLSSMKAW